MEGDSMRVSNRQIRAHSAALVVLLLVTIPAFAQSNGTILGVVRDASGAVVPDASVTITNSETALSRSVRTGSDGAFRVPALPVGHYDLRVEKTGFLTMTQRGLNLEVAQELTARRGRDGAGVPRSRHAPWP